jgi:hypothetical protein
MTVFSDCKDLASDIEAQLIVIEGWKGPQPKLRHWLHGAQSELETVIGAPQGSLTPNGQPSGGKPPPSP